MTEHRTRGKSGGSNTAKRVEGDHRREKRGVTHGRSGMAWVQPGRSVDRPGRT